jgi:hypothetical protein
LWSFGESEFVSRLELASLLSERSSWGFVEVWFSVGRHSKCLKSVGLVSGLDLGLRGEVLTVSPGIRIRDLLVF